MTTVKVTGTHFVGERESRPTHSPRGHEIDYLDSEEELEWRLSQEVVGEALRKSKHDNLRAYIRFWAVGAGPRSRRAELAFHRTLSCWSPCDGCGNCRCRQPITGGWARCLCAIGRKQLSPYRIVWRNSAEKTHALTRVWEIGRGWTPREAEKYSQSARGLD